MPQENGQFQHYISQFLLRNFKDKKSRREIWRYNLTTGECTFEPIKNLAGTSNAWDSGFEKAFSALESEASKIIKKIIKSKKEERSREPVSLTINNDENLIFLNYIIWLTTLQPKRAEFILNHPRNKEDCKRWFYTPSELSAEQEKLRDFYREQYEATGKIPSVLALMQQHVARFDEIYRHFGRAIFLCTSMDNPFILSDHYIVPIVKNNYKIGENPWEAAAQIYFPIASDVCLVWSNKKLLETEIKQLSEQVDIEGINRTAAAYAEMSKGECIYGCTHDVLEKTVENYKQRGYLGWKNTD